VPDLRHHHVTTADGVVLHVVEAGDPTGRPVVLVHGFSMSGRVWERQFADPALAHLRLVAVDLRGHGESQGATGTDPLAPEQLTREGMDGGARLWSQDLDAVRDGLGLETPTLVGWSFGGAVVQGHLYAHGGLGDVPAALILCAPNALGPVPEDDPAARVASPEAIGALVATARADEAELPGAVDAFVRRVLAEGPDDAPPDDEVRGHASEAVRCAPQTRAAMLAHAYDLRPFLAGLPVGERDRIVAVIAEQDQVFQAPAMHEVWSAVGVRTVLLAGSSHTPQWRDPPAFARVLLDVVD
jgi:non-heme chloroperoxidase